MTIQPIATIFYRFRDTLISGLVFLLLSSNAFAEDMSESNGPIVVTIKPLYSLVAQLTEGIETPVLLMKQLQSPHHYTMRPSERALLANARMVIWTGPQMETYLSKIINNQNNTAVTVSAIQADGITLLEARNKHAHDIHKASGTHPDDLTIDPHAWLSTHCF